jgi:hypothetical protein
MNRNATYKKKPQAATAGGGGKNEQAPTPSLSFIPSQQKRPTLIPAHSAEGKTLPAHATSRHH